MKYIDAEKLKVDIKKRYEEMLNRAKIDAYNEEYWNGKADSYRAIYDLIDSLQQEHPVLPGIEDPGIPGKDYIPVDWVDACEMYGKWKIVKQEQPEVDLEKEIDNYYHDNLGFIIGPNDTKDIVSNISRHFYELGLNARKEK